MHGVGERMKVLIVYDSVSPAKATASIAEIIGGVLKEKGLAVDSFFVNNADKVAVKEYDCLLAGAPTMQFRATPAITRFLDGLPSAECSGKLAAAFDTQVKSRFSGSAVKGIESKLKNSGFKLVAEPLVAYVDGKLRQNEWRFREGEPEKAKTWALELAKALTK